MQSWRSAAWIGVLGAVAASCAATTPGLEAEPIGAVEFEGLVGQEAPYRAAGYGGALYAATPEAGDVQLWRVEEDRAAPVARLALDDAEPVEAQPAGRCGLTRRVERRLSALAEAEGEIGVGITRLRRTSATSPECPNDEPDDLQLLVFVVDGEGGVRRTLLPPWSIPAEVSQARVRDPAEGSDTLEPALLQVHRASGGWHALVRRYARRGPDGLAWTHQRVEVIGLAPGAARVELEGGAGRWASLGGALWYAEIEEGAVLLRRWSGDGGAALAEARVALEGAVAGEPGFLAPLPDGSGVLIQALHEEGGHLVGVLDAAGRWRRPPQATPAALSVELTDQGAAALVGWTEAGLLVAWLDDAPIAPALLPSAEEGCGWNLAGSAASPQALLRCYGRPTLARYRLTPRAVAPRRALPGPGQPAF